MADTKPKRQIKKTESVRARSQKAESPKKPRRIRQVTSTAGEGLKTASSAGRKEYHPIKMPDNRVGRFLGKSRKAIPRFFRESWAELKLVTWPNRSETFKLTSAVILFAITLGGLIAVTDYGLEKLFRSLLDL